MFSLLVCGIGIVLLNYLNLLPGGDADNAYLLFGLVLIVGAFGFATKLR